MNVVDYLFQQSAESDRPFLMGGQEQINYSTLFANIGSIAGWLRNNLGTDQKIILISDNNLFFITAYLGIMKSGNVCVPLNPAITPESLGHIVRQCDCKNGLCSGKIGRAFSV